MPNSLTERDWELLLKRIKDGECTPFIGAGACDGYIPMAAEIAQNWSSKFNYPLKDCSDLTRVAQYVAIEYDHMYPKTMIKEIINNADHPNFDDPEEPHGFLASLPLPIYITTNYDNFMMQALKSKHKDPKLAICKWNDFIENEPSIFDRGSEYEPNPANPTVFHLHGHIGIRQSIVLTQDDYLDFLVRQSKDVRFLPLRIQQAWAGTSLLFLGYSLTDWDFLVLFRSIVQYLQISIITSHVSVQLVPRKDYVSETQIQKVQKYFDNYYHKKNISVFWGTCKEFIKELKQRLEYFNLEK